MYATAQRVRLADASFPAERDTGVAASDYTLNDDDKRAIAAVLHWFGSPERIE